MRGQKHYETEQQILDDIEASRKKITVLENEAAVLDASAAEMFQRVDDPKNNDADRNWLKESAHHKRDEANHARAKVTSLLENRIPQLGQTLAAFRTEPMFFMAGDRSTVIQR